MLYTLVSIVIMTTLCMFRVKFTMTVSDCSCHMCQLQDWNHHGVKRISRMLAVLQPPLSSVGRSSDMSAKSDANKPFDRARAYYGLLLCSPEALIRAAADQPTKFSLAEYTALLQVSLSMNAYVCTA